MGKAKWWVCSDCTSLNDLPANKCYKCRVEKPPSPRLIDDEYSEVHSVQSRVGVSVDLSKLGDLSARDPLETAKGGSVIEAFGNADASPAAPAAIARPPRPAGPDWSKPRVMPPAPLRDPTPRSISAIGGRPWSDAEATTPPLPQAATAPPPNGYAPSNGYAPANGYAPPNGYVQPGDGHELPPPPSDDTAPRPTQPPVPPQRWSEPQR